MKIIGIEDLKEVLASLSSFNLTEKQVQGIIGLTEMADALISIQGILGLYEATPSEIISEVRLQIRDSSDDYAYGED